MSRKKDWLVALALSVTMAGVASAQGGALLEIDGIKGESVKKRPKSEKGTQKPMDIAPKPEEPQKGLLLPAVQKASDIAPDTPPPSPRSKPQVAVGDINGDGRADAHIRRETMTVREAGEKPLENSSQAPRGKHFRDAKLTTRKAGEGQSRTRGQIRTNQ